MADRSHLVTNLRDADLTGANLTDVTGITEAHLKSAEAQTGVAMPDGARHAEESPRPKNEDLQHRARRVLRSACAHLAQAQSADGAWRVHPAPRLLENALACLIADAFVPELRPHLSATRRWVQAAPVQNHHEVPRLIESWLQAWVGGADPTASLDVSHPIFSEPVFCDRRNFFLALALAVGAPVRGGPSREELQAQVLERLLARQAVRLKRWSGAELAALFLLLADEAPSADTEEALKALREAQSASGSFGGQMGATLVALAALRRWAPTSEAFARALDFLLRERTTAGVWCFSSTEVWDTALLCRALEGCEDLEPAMFERAWSFLLRSQNEDGGWPYREGVESDTDTTAMAMLALPRTDAGTSASGLGRAYLERMRTPAGLWLTWQSRDDPPAEDVVAHAIMALRKWGTVPAFWAPAGEWLALRARQEGGCRAHWYNIDSYAAHEVGLALGPSHDSTRHLAREFVERQNPDGGWPPTQGAASSAAATGMALALLTFYLPSEHLCVTRAIHYLAELQEPGGSWPGPLQMYGPRPFATDYPMQIHALSVHGLAAVARASRTPPLPLTEI